MNEDQALWTMRAVANNSHMLVNILKRMRERNFGDPAVDLDEEEQLLKTAWLDQQRLKNNTR